MSYADDPEAAARFKTRLESELVEIGDASAATEGARRPVALDQQSVGRLSRMDALQNQAMAAGAEGRRRARRSAIRAALARLAEGEFGYCTECGDPIAPRRLEIDPTAMRCMECSA